MTTRQALLRVLFGLLLGSTLVIGALSFFEFRRALQQEIAGNLQFGASTVMQRIDTFLFAHMENMRVWRNLEVMQDIRVNDVDKRLSHFLSDLRAGQGTVYQALLCTDASGRIVAASDPALIGRRGPVAARWEKVTGTTLNSVFIEPVYGQAGDAIVLRTTIPNAFGPGTIGDLYALLDRHAVLDLLDQAVAGGPASLLLLDREKRVIAGSAALRGSLDISRLKLSHWTVPGMGSVSYIHDGAVLGYRSLLVGAATSAGYQQFKGLGWHILMVEPTSISFWPVWRLLWAMLIVLVLTLLLGFWISSRLAARIAQPVVALTEFTRRFRQGGVALPVLPATTISEVEELQLAYVEMIQALERSRAQIVRAGKLAVVGEMAAIMAHEVRTPMGIIRSSAQLLERQPDLGEKERELIGFILSETERLNRLVTMLLESARPTPPDFSLQDLHAIVDSVISLLASRAEHAGVQLTREFETREMMFECDREQMMQVFLNLVLNALAFVPEGGHVTVSTHRETGALWVSVTDDGPGVPPDLRQRIFDPFFSHREGGIGLGLTVVQQIVQVHGGEIGVSESASGGASFNLRFETR
ncbi:MAG TPA: ATP-binding protein [Rhodanobacter sp.]|nr:ATP-binding protein [Rhodanobacter sp.]